MFRLLSSDDVQQIAGNNADVITYDAFKHAQNIDDVFGSHNALILLYRHDPNTGHWVALIRKPHLIEYFDSYAYPIDKPLTFVKKSKTLNNMLGQEYPYLSKLLYEWLGEDPRNKVIRNTYRYQGIKTKDSTTCGRWVGYRLRHRNMSIDEFEKQWNKIKKDSNGKTDEIIVRETEKFL